MFILLASWCPTKLCFHKSQRFMLGIIRHIPKLYGSSGLTELFLDMGLRRETSPFVEMTLDECTELISTYNNETVQFAHTCKYFFKYRMDSDVYMFDIYDKAREVYIYVVTKNNNYREEWLYKKIIHDIKAFRGRAINMSVIMKED